MNRLSFALSFALAGTVAFGQSAPPATELPPGVIAGVPNAKPASTQAEPRAFPDPAQQARFDTVKGYMRLSSPLERGDLYCAGLGDEAAFFIYTMMVYSSPPLSAAQTLTALDIIHKPFANPLAIQRGQTKPTKSLALLKFIQATAVDQIVKERIATETNFLNAVPATIVAPPMGVPGPPPPPGTTPFF